MDSTGAFLGFDEFLTALFRLCQNTVDIIMIMTITISMIKDIIKRGTTMHSTHIVLEEGPRETLKI